MWSTIDVSTIEFYCSTAASLSLYLIYYTDQSDGKLENKHCRIYTEKHNKHQSSSETVVLLV